MRSFFDTHYMASNMTAVLVGSFDPATVRELAETYFGRLPATAPRDNRAWEAADLSESGVSASCDCRTQVHLLFRSRPFSDPEAAVVDVVVSLLNGRSGRLHRSLVLEQELAFSAFARQQGYRAGGELVVVAEAKGDTEAEVLLRALDLELRRLLTEPPDDRELSKAKNRLMADGIRALEEPSQLMLQMLIHAALGEPDHLDVWQSRLDDVTAADVARVARELFADKPRVVGLFERSSAPGSTP